MRTNTANDPKMRKIVAGLFISMDGVVESPEQWGFQYFNDEMTEMIAAGIAQADAVLLGPRTYAAFAKLWPNQGNEVPMANFLNNSPKYVVSGTPDTLRWQPATLIKGVLSEELAKLKQKPGKNIQIPGSPRLVRSLLRDGLLDEVSLSICPIVVGSGLRLFDEGITRMNLKLIDARPFSTGAVSVTYQPLPPGDPAPSRPVDFPEAAARK
ncbi:MAG: dihydrofolate reductase family protein [Bryobacteraceae bacterium]